MRLALINAGVVVNSIEAEMDFALSLGYDAVIESDTAYPGVLWDGEKFVFPEYEHVNVPVEVAAPEPLRHITRLAFLQRITMPEHVAIELASIHNPTAPSTQHVAAATLRKMLQLVNAANWIDLDRPDTRGMVQQLEAMGLLETGRALQILDGEIADIERPESTTPRAVEA